METDSQKQESGEQTGVDAEVTLTVDEFFGFGETSETSTAARTPFDALFGGMPGRAGDPSTKDFAPPKIPSLEEILIAKPEFRFKLETLIIPQYDKGIDRLQNRKRQMGEALKKGGLSAKEKTVLQDMIKKFDQAIAKAEGEKQKAIERQEDLNAEYQQEIAYRTDINGDRFIGDPNDKENSYMVGRLPNGQEVILTHDKKPAFDPMYNPNYLPALASTTNMQLVSRADHADPQKVPPEKGKLPVDEVFQLTPYRPDGFTESPLGAQLHMVPPEGLWVEADEKGQPKIVTDKETGDQKLKPKAFETVTREDGEEMLGQKSPLPEEVGKWVFVRINDLSISTQSLDKTAPNENGIERPIDGGNVHFEFKGKVGGRDVLVARIRVQGYETQNAPPTKTDNTDRVEASSVGLAISSGKMVNEGGEEIYTMNSSRIRALNVDATRYTSTGKILPSASELYETLGIDPSQAGADGTFTGADSVSGKAVEKAEDVERGNSAANYTLLEGWLSTKPKKMLETEDEEKLEETAAEISRRFGGEQVDKPRQIYLPSEDQYNEFKTGLISLDISGNIVGTNFNDLIVTKFKNPSDHPEFFPIGMGEIRRDHAAYSNVIDGNEGGRDIVISKGGDLYARNVTFVWREPVAGASGDQIYISVKEAGGDKNQAAFVHVGDENAVMVAIDNSQEMDDDLGKQDGNEKGVKDDWFEGPENMNFSMPQQSDVSGSTMPGLQDKIGEAFSTARGELLKYIQNDPATTAEGFDTTTWDLPEWIKDEDSDSGEGGFFSDYTFFAGPAVKEEEIVIK